MSRLSLVIFGATGFTGKHAVEEMVRTSKKYPGLTWGIAGRSQKKLEILKLEISQKTGEDQSNIKTIIADIKDEKSLKEMCGQAKVIVNCCGPYRLYGEPVVRAAIESKSHYVDVSGEPQFMETMQLEYHKQAADAGVYIISACGFDSIPNDLGVVFLQENFGGTLNAVESYLAVDIPYELTEVKQGTIHYGTWESLVHGIAHSNELRPLRKKLYPERMPVMKPKLQKRPVLHQRDGSWCLPFPGADESVVYRSQRPQPRPVQFKPYVKFRSLAQAVAMLLGLMLIFCLTKLRFTRTLLLKYPRLFSAGAVTREGPTPAVMAGTRFQFQLYGTGWDEHADVDATPPNKTVLVKVCGTNPGYGATVVALLYSAITILKEQDKMPGIGGVLTTATAFRNTSIIQKLNENDLKFEVVESTLNK